MAAVEKAAHAVLDARAQFQERSVGTPAHLEKHGGEAAKTDKAGKSAHAPLRTLADLYETVTRR